MRSAGGADSTGSGTATAVPRTLAPLKVEGLDIALDVHGTEGQPGYYRRLTVKCPCDSHCDCSKRRNTGPKQTKHGEFEPYAYLGVWVRHGPLCSVREDHMSFKPSAKEVKAYMREQKWAMR